MADANTVLTVSAVGQVSFGSTDTVQALKNRKLTALLMYLAAAESKAETREKLAGLLWSGSSEERARASLRQTLRQLRYTFDEIGYFGLYTDKLIVSLDPMLVRSEVNDAVSAVENGEVPAILLNSTSFVDSILNGFDDLDPMFNAWLLAFRQRIHERLIRGLESILKAERTAGDRYIRAADAIINLDPTHEPACRALMHARAVQGDTAAALRAYNALWNLLDHEYDMEPSQDTQDLVAAIKIGLPREEVPEATAAPDPLPPNSVSRQEEGIQPNLGQLRLVLTIDTFSPEEIATDQQHLVSGFRHSLITCLVRFREWSVVDGEMTSGAPLPADQTHITLQASVLRFGNTIGLNLTMKERATGLFIWSDRFELQTDRWDALLRRAVTRITSAVKVHLTADQLARLVPERKAEGQVYDMWLRGQSMILNFRPDTWSRAAEMFEQVIRQDPHFAPAYSSLAQLGNTRHIANPGIFHSREVQERTLFNANQASLLDPVDSRAHLSLGWAHAYGGNFGQAELHFAIAHDLNDHDPWTLLSSAQGFAFLSEDAKAGSLASAASDLSVEIPQTYWGYYAGIRFTGGDYSGALDAAINAGDALVNNGAWRAASRAMLGDMDGARRDARRCVDLVRRSWCGDAQPTDENVGAWLLQLFPFRQEMDWRKLRDGLDAAGIPVAAVPFDT